MTDIKIDENSQMIGFTLLSLAIMLTLSFMFGRMSFPVNGWHNLEKGIVIVDGKYYKVDRDQDEVIIDAESYSPVPEKK